ncbi:DNA alkylation repair protein [Paenibacillus beijingensis]|uniref:DNA alkylation repair protein n=1 Tax=Paenibacillus beijingensis TaxID=1126833 RepID=A0A0D5NID5_9BACL|nr:DNA alkylation repair protein [Paenibacillus beijingensis]AJY74673.1 DNA alkylation repair protein [Paenibacillus beijingensis]
MESFKNVYSQTFIEQFAGRMERISARFDGRRFVALVLDEGWEQKEFKQRIRHITHALTAALPASYGEALDMLLAAAPQCRGVEYLFFPDFVEVNGLDEWDRSIDALERLTPFSSSEFDVRPFIRRDQERMMVQMAQWARHDSEHVRRLASEGCRPRLPWAQALDAFKADPAPIVPILEALKEDESLYVRKSVANNLNDMAKDHPSLVLKLAAGWYGKHPHTDWIVRHGCRTLLKQAHPDALRLFGLGDSGGIEVLSVELTRTSVNVGEELPFTVRLHNGSGGPRKLRVEYEIGYRKANGRLAPKRFKLSERIYDPGTSVVTGKQSFKPLTTRRHYPGTHRLAIIVNGEEKAAQTFGLI